MVPIRREGCRDTNWTRGGTRETSLLAGGALYLDLEVDAYALDIVGRAVGSVGTPLTSVVGALHVVNPVTPGI